jgi:hypothetical protein
MSTQEEKERLELLQGTLDSTGMTQKRVWSRNSNGLTLPRLAVFSMLFKLPSLKVP